MCFTVLSQLYLETEIPYDESRFESIFPEACGFLLIFLWRSSWRVRCWMKYSPRHYHEHTYQVKTVRLALICKTSDTHTHLFSSCHVSSSLRHRLKASARRIPSVLSMLAVHLRSLNTWHNRNHDIFPYLFYKQKCWYTAKHLLIHMTDWCVTSSRNCLLKANHLTFLFDHEALFHGTDFRENFLQSLIRSCCWQTFNK